MSKHVEVRYLDQNLGAILKMIMDDPKCELKFFEGLKRSAPSAEELIQSFEARSREESASE